MNYSKMSCLLILLIFAMNATLFVSSANNGKKPADESNVAHLQSLKGKSSNSELKIAHNTSEWVTFDDAGPSFHHTSPTPTSIDKKSVRHMRSIANEGLKLDDREKTDDKGKTPNKDKGRGTSKADSLSPSKKLDEREIQLEKTDSIGGLSKSNSKNKVISRKFEKLETNKKATKTNTKDKDKESCSHSPLSDLHQSCSHSPSSDLHQSCSHSPSSDLHQSCSHLPSSDLHQLTSHKTTSEDSPTSNSTSDDEIVPFSSFSSLVPGGYTPLVSLKDNPLLLFFHSNPYEGPKRIPDFGWKLIVQSTRQQVELNYLLGKEQVTNDMSGHAVDLEVRTYPLHKMDFNNSKLDEKKKDFFHIKECIRDSSVEALQLLYPQYRLEEYDQIKPVEIKYEIVENFVILPHIFMEQGRENDDEYRQEVRAVQTMIQCDYTNVKVFDKIASKIARVNLFLYVADNDRGDVFYFRPFRLDNTKFLPTYYGKRGEKFHPSGLWKKLPYLSNRYYRGKMGKMRREQTVNTRLDSVKNDTKLTFFEPRPSPRGKSTNQGDRTTSGRRNDSNLRSGANTDRVIVPPDIYKSSS